MSIGFPSAFKRLNDIPLDDSQVFNSLQEFEDYLQGGTVVVGLTHAVKTGENTPSFFIINEDKSYSPIQGGDGGGFTPTTPQLSAMNSGVTAQWKSDTDAELTRLEDDKADKSDIPDVSDFATEQYVDNEISGAVTATQFWLPAVELVTDLPTPPSDTRSYLCRVKRENNVYQHIPDDEWRLYSENTDFLSSSNGTVSEVVEMSWSEYQALPNKDSKTVYNIPDAPTPPISGGVLVNVEYASNDDATTTTGTIDLGTVNRENGSIGFRGIATGPRYMLVSFPTPYNPITDIIELQISNNRTTWVDVGSLSLTGGATPVTLESFSISGGIARGFGLRRTTSGNNAVFRLAQGQYTRDTSDWSSVLVDYYWRVVKKTFLRVTLSEWNMIKSSGLKQSPHLWSPNQHIPFGDGTWGVRFVGTYTTAANITNNISLAQVGTGTKILNCGGVWNHVAQALMQVGHSYEDSSQKQWSVMYTNSVGAISVALYTHNIRTNAEFDFWCIYTKAV